MIVTTKWCNTPTEAAELVNKRGGEVINFKILSEVNRGSIIYCIVANIREDPKPETVDEEVERRR